MLFAMYMYTCLSIYSYIYMCVLMTFHLEEEWNLELPLCNALLSCLEAMTLYELRSSEFENIYDITA